MRREVQCEASHLQPAANRLGPCTGACALVVLYCQTPWRHAFCMLSAGCYSSGSMFDPAAWACSMHRCLHLLFICKVAAAATMKALSVSLVMVNAIFLYHKHQTHQNFTLSSSVAAQIFICTSTRLPHACSGLQPVLQFATTTYQRSPQKLMIDLVIHNLFPCSVGVGLYFKLLVWLQALFFGLTLAAIPYFIAINTSVFTDEPHKDDHGFGVKVRH